VVSRYPVDFPPMSKSGQPLDATPERCVGQREAAHDWPAFWRATSPKPASQTGRRRDGFRGRWAIGEPNRAPANLNAFPVISVLGEGGVDGGPTRNRTYNLRIFVLLSYLSPYTSIFWS